MTAAQKRLQIIHQRLLLPLATRKKQEVQSFIPLLLPKICIITVSCVLGLKRKASGALDSPPAVLSRGILLSRKKSKGGSSKKSSVAKITAGDKMSATAAGLQLRSLSQRLERVVRNNREDGERQPPQEGDETLQALAENG